MQLDWLALGVEQPAQQASVTAQAALCLCYPANRPQAPLVQGVIPQKSMTYRSLTAESAYTKDYTIHELYSL